MSSSFLAIGIQGEKEAIFSAILDYVNQRDGLFESTDSIVEYEHYTCKQTKILGVLEKKVAILCVKVFSQDDWTILLDDFDQSWDYSNELLSMAASLSYKLESNTCFLNWDKELELMHCAHFYKGEVVLQCKSRYDMKSLYEENISVRDLFDRLHENNPHNWDVLKYEEFLALDHEERDKHYPRLSMALLPFDLYNFCAKPKGEFESALYKFAVT